MKSQHLKHPHLSNISSKSTTLNFPKPDQPVRQPITKTPHLSFRFLRRKLQLHFNKINLQSIDLNSSSFLSEDSLELRTSAMVTSPTFHEQTPAETQIEQSIKTPSMNRNRTSKQKSHYGSNSSKSISFHFATPNLHPSSSKSNRRQTHQRHTPNPSFSRSPRINLHLLARPQPQLLKI